MPLTVKRAERPRMNVLDHVARNAPPRRSGDCALHRAARRGDAMGVRKAIAEIKDPVSLSDMEGCTALAISCALGHVEVVMELLERHVPDRESTNDVGDTPLLLCCRHVGKHATCLECAEALLKDGANYHAYNLTGDTALVIAARVGHAGMAELLLSYGADPGLSTDSGDTALAIAVRRHKASGSDVLKLFLRPHIYLPSKEQAAFKAALEAAAADGTPPPVADTRALDAVLARRKQRSGATALHIAAQMGNADAVRLILGAAGDRKRLCSMRDESLRTPLVTARFHRRVAVVAVLEKLHV